MGNAESATFHVEPVCDGREPRRIHVEEVLGTTDRKYKFIFVDDKLSCPIAAECLQNFNLPTNGGLVSKEPLVMKDILNRVTTCLQNKIKSLNSAPTTSNSQDAQVTPTSYSQDAQVSTGKSAVGIKIQHDNRIRIATLCDGQFRSIRHPDVKKDGFFLFGPNRSRTFNDYNSVQLDKLTCNEALQCMNRLEMMFDREDPPPTKSYVDRKGRSLDELRNSIRDQCVNIPPSSSPTPDLAKDDSGVTAADASDVTDMNVIVLIGFFSVIIMIAITLMLYLLFRKS